jgi:1-acyl-sn-glycerol-3-phosphate acyltransferase
MTTAYRMGWLAARALFRCYFGWRVFHPERVPASGPAILTPNHASFIDPLLVGAAIDRQIRFLARDSLMRVPLLSSLLRAWDTIPVDRDGGSPAGLKAILDCLKSGAAVLVFPEGTRSRDGRLQPTRPGIGLLVIKSKAPVIPVRVFGTYEAYGRHLRFPRPRRLSLKFGLPLDFSEVQAEASGASKARLRELYAQVAARILEAISRLEPCQDPPPPPASAA